MIEDDRSSGVVSFCASWGLPRWSGGSHLHDHFRAPFLEKMGNRTSCGMASQLRDSFNASSKIFQSKCEHLNVSWDALGPWSSYGHCLSCSSGLAWNSDSGVLDLNLRDCVQRYPMDNFSFSIQESLRKSRRLYNDKERISGQLSCTRCLQCLSRSSDSGNCLNISPP